MNEVDFVAITFLSILVPLYTYLIADFIYGLIKKLRRRKR